jgi:hypothetical protein
MKGRGFAHVISGSALQVKSSDLSAAEIKIKRKTLSDQPIFRFLRSKRKDLSDHPVTPAYLVPLTSDCLQSRQYSSFNVGTPKAAALHF